MKIKPLILVLTAAGVLGATGYGTYYYGMLRGMQMAATPANTATPAANGAAQTTDPSAGRRVLYWHDPMVPGQKFDKPGKSPFMDMQLVPVYAEADGDEGKIVISPRVQQNLGMRTAEVTRGTLAPAVEVTGNVTYNERDVAVVYARSNGFVEKLHVRAPLDPVRKGQPLAELYVPDWVAAQEEYLSAKRMTGSGLDALVDGARQRMRLIADAGKDLEKAAHEIRKQFLVSPDRGVNARPRAGGGPLLVSEMSGKVFSLAKGDKPQIIFGSALHGMTSVDPDTGKIIWELGDLMPLRVVASLIVANDLIITNCGSGGAGKKYAAVRPGSADGSKKPEVAWSLTKGIPYVPTTVAQGDFLYTVSDGGIATCMKAADGETVWQGRLDDKFFGSPVIIDGHIYVAGQDGIVHVFKADPKEFIAVSRNPLGEKCYTTPAISGGRMYLRTVKHLISIGGRKVS